MLSNKSINKIIDEGKKKLSIEEWNVDWEYGTIDQGAIDTTYWTEKRAHIILEKGMDKKRTRIVIYHELMHLVLMPVSRGVSDYADHLIKSKKMRSVFDEMLNTRENEVIDFIVTQILGI